MATVQFATPTDLDNVYIYKNGANKIALKQRKVRLVFVLGGDTHVVANGDVLSIAAPEAFTLEEIKASVVSASVSQITFGVTVGAVNIMTTPVTIDGNELHTATAAVPNVIDPTKKNVAEDAVIAVTVSNQGDGAATGAVVYLLGYVSQPT